MFIKPLNTKAEINVRIDKNDALLSSISLLIYREDPRGKTARTWFRGICVPQRSCVTDHAHVVMWLGFVQHGALYVQVQN